jgi:hypothetical protein
MARVHLAAVDDMSIPQRPAVVADGRLHDAQVEVDLDAAFARQVQVPVRQGDEDEAAHDVAQCRRDQRFPDVEARAEVWRAVEDGDGDEEHVGDDVVER